jgi:hypothetical protein
VRPSSLERLSHQSRRFVEDSPELVVGALSERAPGRDARLPERLRLPYVADPGNDSLVEQDVAELTALVDVAESLGRDRLAQDVRPEPRDPATLELEYGAVP